MQGSGVVPEFDKSTVKHGNDPKLAVDWAAQAFLTTCWTSPTGRRSLPKTSVSCAGTKAGISLSTKRCETHSVPPWRAIGALPAALVCT